jgi:UDP-N-acetylglucosamine 4-epimerase
MNEYEKKIKYLLKNKKTWLITGVAGFIGSNLLETLLKLNQKVIGLDNFSTGFHKNLEEVKTKITSEQWKNFILVNGDIRKLEDCKRSMNFSIENKKTNIKEKINIDYVLHHAALGSVPRSLKEPAEVNEVNITGFLNVLIAANELKVKKIIYATSSSTYGDNKDLWKIEELIGKPLSPYAVTKYVNELYADVFNRSYGIDCIGLRYFNVFGERQNPKGEYAAVIPNWIDAIKNEKKLYINGDGTTSRDFCYVSNVVQANILAACSDGDNINNTIYNIAVGETTTLNEILIIMKEIFKEKKIDIREKNVKYRDFRKGDIKHSMANIKKAKEKLQYEPIDNVYEGMKKTIEWYLIKK